MRKTKQSTNPVRKISKVGKFSYAITLPRNILRSLGWRKKQKLVVKKSRGGIRISDWEKDKK